MTICIKKQCLKTCCFCIQLKAGVYVFMFVDLIPYFYEISATAISGAPWIFETIYFIAYITLLILFIVGSCLCRSSFCIGYLIVRVFSIMSVPIIVLKTIPVLGTVPTYLISVFVVVLEIYCYIVIHSLFAQIMEQETDRIVRSNIDLEA